MNQQELDLASKLLASNVLEQIQQVVNNLSKEIMQKFDRGPKPGIGEVAQVILNVEVPARLMYEVSERIKGI